MNTNRKSNKIKSKFARFDITLFVIILGVLGLLVLILYLGYRTSISESKIFTLNLLALFAGLLFETIRINDNWKNVIYYFIGTFFLSLTCFLKGIGSGNYNFENNLEAYPYIFIFYLSLITVVFNKEKVSAKLTEGITLLQSLSLIYWTIDYGFINLDNWLVKTILIIGLILSVFSIIQSLTYFQLSKTVRLILSIWSTIIMLAFAVDNIYRVYQNEDIETTKYLSQGLYIGLQYFLLGVSAIYITQNYIFLAGFLPSKNGNYRRDLKETKKDHIERYSDNQVLIGHSLFCILYALTFFGLNYKYQILPRHTMIWLVFLTFPLILKIIVFRNKKNYS